MEVLNRMEFSQYHSYSQKNTPKNFAQLELKKIIAVELIKLRLLTSNVTYTIG